MVNPDVRWVHRMEKLIGKSALVTGANGGIGRAVVRRFVQEGAAVIATDIQPDQSDELIGAALTLYHDVASDADWIRVLESSLHVVPRIDIMVHLAGVLSLPTELAEVEVSDWTRVMDVNATGSFLALRTIIPHMAAAGGGSIVMIASLAALVGGASLGAYAASKGAVRSLARAAAVRHGPQGIRVNAIFPGLIESPMTAGEMLERHRTSVIAQQPIKRIGQPDDVAAAATFLASDEAAFITAAELVVDGGWIKR